MRVEKSQALYRDAKQYLSGGLCSPAGAFRAVGRDPRFIVGGSGGHIFDVDGNEYVDYTLSRGALVLGHAHPKVVRALSDAVSEGVGACGPTERETLLAKSIIDAVPSVDTVRFTGSETEATVSAIRLARAHTKRRKVVKFAGCYHGYADSLPAQAAAAAAGGARPLGGPCEVLLSDISVVPYNDLESAEVIVKSQQREIAAIIVEPVATNMGVVPPAPDFLAGLRALCDQYGILLIFDEVATAFRVGWGGAAALYGVGADITCLGRVIGGGLPLGAYGGRREVMQAEDEDSECHPHGALSANPLALTAGVVTLRELRDGRAYAQLELLGAALADGLRAAAEGTEASVVINRVGSLMAVYFSEAEVTDFASACASSSDAFKRYFGHMIESGIHIAPSRFGCMCVSLAHTEEDLQRTVEVAAEAFAKVTKEQGT